MNKWPGSLEELQNVLHGLHGELELYYESAVMLVVAALAKGGKVLTCGNGGSAAHAAHLAAELSVRFDLDRRALSGLALTEPCALTAAANDFGYPTVFARQIEALGRPGDCLVAFSTSGKSANIREAIVKAKFAGLRTLGFAGQAGMADGCDVEFRVPSSRCARIQEAHQYLIHALVEGVESHLPKGEDPRYGLSGDTWSEPP